MCARVCVCMRAYTCVYVCVRLCMCVYMYVNMCTHVCRVLRYISELGTKGTDHSRTKTEISVPSSHLHSRSYSCFLHFPLNLSLCFRSCRIVCCIFMSGLTGCHSKYKSSPEPMVWHTHTLSCMRTHTHSVTDRKMDIEGFSFIWRWCISSLVSIAIDGCQATAECVAQGLKGPSVFALEDVPARNTSSA